MMLKYFSDQYQLFQPIANIYLIPNQQLFNIFLMFLNVFKFIKLSYSQWHAVLSSYTHMVSSDLYAKKSK